MTACVASVAAAAALLVALSHPVAAQDPAAEPDRHEPAAERVSASPQPQWELQPEQQQLEQQRPEQPQPVQWQLTSQPDTGRRYWKGVWIATWAAFIAVNVLDAHSSSGRYEANPLLRDNAGIFSGRRAILVKSAAGGGFFALQCWLARRNPAENHYKAFAVATGAAAAALGAVAVRNYGVRQAAEAQPAAVAPAYLLRQP